MGSVDAVIWTKLILCTSFNILERYLLIVKDLIVSYISELEFWSFVIGSLGGLLILT